MDKIAQKANQARSVRGGKFETALNELFEEMKKKGKIKDFKFKPKIFGGEFNPDWLVEDNKGNMVSIDSTTTARTDRLRGKQWDAYGTKLYFEETKGQKIKSVVVVQDTDISQKEKDNFRRCKTRVKLPHSSLDEVVSIKELVSLLEN